MNEILNNFKNRGFKALFFENANDAKDYLKNEVKDEFISFGGSMTLEELGLYDILKESNKVLWHWKGDNINEAKKSNVFFTSANAVTKDGLIINIDGTGNRVAMTIHGPNKCYFVIGKNKIANNLEEAYKRAKDIACVKNAVRLKLDTPCAKLGRCVDCNSEKRICRAISILERPTSKMEVYVIIINDNLGY